MTPAEFDQAVAEYARTVAAAAPPLTAEQRDRLTVLLRPLPTTETRRAS